MQNVSLEYGASEDLKFLRNNKNVHVFGIERDHAFACDQNILITFGLMILFTTKHTMEGPLKCLT